MIVLKFGGAVLNAALKDASFFDPFRDAGSLILVHGGGPEINQLADKLGLETQFVDGQRVTTPGHMDVVEMALSGNMNPKLVRALRSRGMDAFGLSGADGGLFRCTIEDGGKLGQVGAVKSVRGEIFELLLEKGLLPVVAPCGTLEDGRACNVNADLAACAVAAEVRASQLLFLTDQDGLLGDDKKAIPRLSAAELRKIREGANVYGGMKVKSRSILEYLNACPFGRVQIVNGFKPEALAAALRGEPAGTVIEA